MKAYKIFSRETNQIFAYALTLEAAQKVKGDIELRDFENWINVSYPEIKERMEASFAHMTKGNNVKFVGTVENPTPTLEEFIEARLNPNKYNEDGEICSCENPKFCDCTYKTKDSIEIAEILIRE